MTQSSRKMFRVAFITTLGLVALGVFTVIWKVRNFPSSKEDSDVNPWHGSELPHSPHLAYSRAALARTTLQGILNHTSPLPANESSGGGVAFVPPCLATNGGVMESTSSLLVTTALTKADNITLRKHNMFHFFSGLFVVPSKGFIPRYSYPVEVWRKDQEDFYVDSTRIPNWPMFQMEQNGKVGNASPCPGNNATFCWAGSGRISAMPFHGTVFLEFLLRLQRRRHDENGNPAASLLGLTQSELHQLNHYWNRIFDYHEFIHEVVMRGCNNHTTIPCYNIIHPWESLLGAPSSPTWQVAMKPTLERMAMSNWTPPFEIPPQIKRSYDYNETIFNGMLFLNQCLSTQIASMDAHQYPYEYEGDAIRHENRLLEACQFAMLDVGYASALAQADKDLQTVGLWLSAQDGGNTMSTSSSWATRMSRVENWNRQNDYVWSVLWHSQEQTFQSRYAIPNINTTEQPFPTMRYVRTPSANNLMVFWYKWHDRPNSLVTGAAHGATLHDEDIDQRLQEMAMQLLRHTGKNSFDCSNSYPIWSAGCNNTSPSNYIDPRWNYFVGLGLSRNKVAFAPFAQYITNATIKLVCGGGSSASYDNEDDPIDSSCARNLTTFQEAFQVIMPDSNGTFDLDECGVTSTSTASILYHLLVDDFDFTSESPIPPIRNSWVITLITSELMIAFAVGVTCVLLSLNIVRRENRLQDMDESTFFREDEAAYDPLMQEVEDSNNRDENDDRDSHPDRNTF